MTASTARKTPVCDDAYIEGRAEVADRLGLACRALSDGTLAVQGEPRRDGQSQTYSVVFGIMPDGRVEFVCTCKAGEFRPGPVPCKHAAAAGRFLEHGGLAAFGAPADAPVAWRITQFANAIASVVRGNR